MNTDWVQHWLRRTLRTATVWNVLAAAGCFLGGLLILYVSFWVTFGVLWFISTSFLHLSHLVLLILASAFMTLVVVIGARQNWADLDPLARQVRLAKDMDITLTPYNRYGMSYSTNAVTAGMFEIRSLASAINFILCGGVKLVFGAVAMLRQVQRLKAIEVDECARVIALLLANPGRQSFEEIVRKLPGLNPVRTFDDLRYIAGVLFLSKDPAGLTLLPELRNELNQASARRGGSRSASTNK